MSTDSDSNAANPNPYPKPLPSITSPTPPQYREIRALQTESTITVYQAYSTTIASAAVSSQRLSASPNFSTTRMTWIKPSWTWVCYRSGYGLKDRNQTCILAITMNKSDFDELLANALVAKDVAGLGKESEEKATPRVQWDPERGPGLERLGYRSLQLGISRQWVEWWVDRIVRIEDVTERARGLKEVVEGREYREGRVSVEELKERGLMPDERVYEVNQEIRKRLRMDLVES